MRSAEGASERFQGRSSGPQRVSPELAEFLHMLDTLEQRFSTRTDDTSES